METLIQQCIPFEDLSAMLLVQLREKGYSPGTIHCIEIELDHFRDYLREINVEAYEPGIGEQFLAHVIAWKGEESNTIKNYRALVSRLNDLFAGAEFLWRHYPKDYETPELFVTHLQKYLDHCRETGNCEKSILRKELACRSFLAQLRNLGCKGPNDLCPEMIHSMTLSGIADSSRPFIRDMLFFWASIGLVNADYSTLIPKKYHKNVLPTVYEKQDVGKIEQSVDCSTFKGKRDYAIVLLVTRLGIRAGDIVGMTFNALDFEADEIRFIQEKTKVPITLAMIPEVKESLRDYIDHGRPKSESDHIFLETRVPYGPLNRTMVHAIITQCMKSAGIDYKEKKHGPHSLRSSLATAMVNSGMPYDATRKVLGHQSAEAIKHYAALDIRNLRRCAVDVPMERGIFAEYLSGRRTFR